MREGVICRNEGVIYGTHKIPSSRAPVGAKKNEVRVGLLQRNKKCKV